MENTLFTKANFDSLEESITVEKKERVVKETFFTIDGQKYEGNDLYDTLQEVLFEFDICVVEPMGSMLVKYGILSTAGSYRNCMSAYKGPNFDKFFDYVKNKLYE